MNTPELIKKIEQDINKFLPILKVNNNKQNMQESTFLSLDNETDTTVKTTTLQEYELFYAPIKRLLLEKSISEKFSETKIKNRFLELYHRILPGKKPEDQKIKNLVTELLEVQTSNYFVISQIENIQIIDDLEYALLNTKIKIIKESDIPFKVDTQLQIDENNFLGKKAIITEVKACDSEKAKDLALQNFYTAFSLLKLYMNNFDPQLKGELMNGRQSVIIHNKKSQKTCHDLSVTGTLPLNHAALNKKLYSELISAGISNLENSSGISKTVCEGLYWFGKGLKEKHPSARLIDFVTVLEGALKKGDERTEIKRLVSERGATLLYDSFEKRKKASEQLKKIYTVRSNVIHTGSLINDKDVASLAGAYARAILIKLIKSSSERGGDFEKFIDYLDDIRLGKKSQ